MTDDSEGAIRILNERKRQIVVDKWNQDHDDKHINGELVKAAACYAMADFDLYTGVIEQNRNTGGIPIIENPDGVWPWGGQEEWQIRRQCSRLRQLEIAGALIAAEIDRILRYQKRNEHEFPKED
jgi:hypothetical protein